MKWCVGYSYTIGEGLCLLFFFFCKLKDRLSICKKMFIISCYSMIYNLFLHKKESECIMFQEK